MYFRMLKVNHSKRNWNTPWSQSTWTSLSRWGIGYQLSNNDIGIMWNDGSKLLLKPDFNRLFYFNEHDVLLYSDAYSSISKGNSPGKSNEKFNQIKNSKSSKPSLQTIIEWRCVEEVWGCTNHSLQAEISK